jgi:hypothetical protein
VRATPRFISIGLLGVMLGSCAWEPTLQDRAHVLSQMTDMAARDDAQCQSSAGSLGSRAYKECRKLLETHVWR